MDWRLNFLGSWSSFRRNPGHPITQAISWRLFGAIVPSASESFGHEGRFWMKATKYLPIRTVRLVATIRYENCGLLEFPQ